MANIDRGLTLGEIELLKSIFGSTIPYSSVKVHNFPYFVLQGAKTAVTPNGQMYYPAKFYEADFSASPLNKRAWFVHEGAHLYQYYSLHWNVMARGIFDRKYDYTLDPTRKFQSYGLEQMGDIAQDYYVLREGGAIDRPYGLNSYATLLPLAQ